MRVLVACEFSGIVREAFRANGHDAWSCDIISSEIPSKYHIQDDVLNHLLEDWDMMIAFPPCTHLSCAGVGWWKYKQKEQLQAIDFFMRLVDAPIKKIAIENPVGKMNTYYRKPDQIINPWQFGHPERKRTCLWLKNLPKLVPTNIVEKQEPIYVDSITGKKRYFVDSVSPSKDRWKKRSRTFQGIAEAMSKQWGI